MASRASRMSLLLLFLLHPLDAAVLAAVGADAVRKDRLAAVGAVLVLDGVAGLVAPAFALLGVGGPPLRDSHDEASWGRGRAVRRRRARTPIFYGQGRPVKR